MRINKIVYVLICLLLALSIFSPGYTVPKTYTISASYNNGGTISPHGVVRVNEGQSKTFYFSPFRNYKVNYIQVDGRRIKNPRSYTFNNIRRNHRIFVCFEKIYTPVKPGVNGISDPNAKPSIRRYSIRISKNRGGRVSPSGTVWVRRGRSKTISFRPNRGYRVRSIYVNGRSLHRRNSYTFYNVNRNQSFRVEFERNHHGPSSDYYFITTSSSRGGRVSPRGRIRVREGNNRGFTFVPNPGYRVSAVYIDNNRISPRHHYTFINVRSNHDVYVEFRRGGGHHGHIRYRITASSSNGGRISPQGTARIKKGRSQRFSFTPDFGYRVKAVYVDNRHITTRNSYMFHNVRRNHSIYVEFERGFDSGFNESFTIRARSSRGGSIRPSGNVNVRKGWSQNFSFWPDFRYKVASVYVDGKKVSTTSPYIFFEVQDDHEIYVQFEKMF